MRKMKARPSPGECAALAGDCRLERNAMAASAGGEGDTKADALLSGGVATTRVHSCQPHRDMPQTRNPPIPSKANANVMVHQCDVCTRAAQWCSLSQSGAGLCAVSLTAQREACPGAQRVMCLNHRRCKPGRGAAAGVPKA